MDSILSNLVITKISAVVTMYHGAGAATRRQNRKRWAIVWKYEGETVYRCNGKTVISNRVHPVILPAGSSYTWECTKAGHYISVEFESPLRGTDLFSFSLAPGEDL